ncbi:hypothetical protein JTB14_034126 [Gonioctena quinquepunctata]|nr:hypothetical protein JTB14_034126 [Gonioctena quinquepunctata]
MEYELQRQINEIEKVQVNKDTPQTFESEYAKEKQVDSGDSNSMSPTKYGKPITIITKAQIIYPTKLKEGDKNPEKLEEQNQMKIEQPQGDNEHDIWLTAMRTKQGIPENQSILQAKLRKKAQKNRLLNLRKSEQRKLQ